MVVQALKKNFYSTKQKSYGDIWGRKSPCKYWMFVAGPCTNKSRKNAEDKLALLNPIDVTELDAGPNV